MIDFILGYRTRLRSLVVGKIVAIACLIAFIVADVILWHILVLIIDVWLVFYRDIAARHFTIVKR